MDADTANNASTSTEDVNTNEVEAESNIVDSLEVLSSSGNAMQEVASVGEILTRLELDLACFSEKLVNLDLFVMHVATRESDFEAFASEKEHTSNEIVERAIEFDLLSGVLDSEVTELGGLLSSVAMEIDNVRKVISSRASVDEAFILVEEKLHDCEKSLKQSQDHILELRAQCTNFHGIVLTSQGDQNYLRLPKKLKKEEEDILRYLGWITLMFSLVAKITYVPLFLIYGCCSPLAFWILRMFFSMMISRKKYI